MNKKEDSAIRESAKLAVLLVAGVGQRLHPLTLDRPKALVEVGAESMLARSVRLLVAHGVEEIVLATGFEEGALRAAMAGVPVPVSYCPNPMYRTTQNSVSLLACEAAVAGRSFYKLDGDLLYHPQVLSRLDAAGGGLRIAVDKGVVLGEEEMKVRLCVDGRRVEALGKGLDPERSDGESIGIERVDGDVVGVLFRGLRDAVGNGETHLYYEDVYGRMIERGVAAEAVDVSDLPWCEVDTMDDLVRAEAMAMVEMTGGDAER